MAEELDLEKYYDIYDISDLDLTEATSENDRVEAENLESIRALKILAARFNITRKIFLCCLMALNASGSKSDFHLWNIIHEEIKEMHSITICTAKQFTMVLDDGNGMLFLKEC